MDHRFVYSVLCRSRFCAGRPEILPELRGGSNLRHPAGVCQHLPAYGKHGKDPIHSDGGQVRGFASTADVWVRIGAVAAAIPSGDINNGTGAELNPICRWIEGETQMSVISAFAAKLSISYFK